jgi:hypothetical protein
MLAFLIEITEIPRKQSGALLASHPRSYAENASPKEPPAGLAIGTYSLMIRVDFLKSSCQIA